MSEVSVTIALFAAYQDAFGAPEIRRRFPAGTTVRAVLDKLLCERPELEIWREVTRFGIDYKFVSPDTILHDGNEVALIPPVSGGSGATGETQIP